MSAANDQAGTDSSGRNFARLYDSDRDRALAQFRPLLDQKLQAGKLLQALNRLDRHDIVVAVTDEAPLGPETAELVITERARALAATGAPHLAEQLLEQMAPARMRDYAFQFNAGRVLSEARLHRQALGYYEGAFRAKPTAQAAERTFQTLLALERYDDAAAAMARIIRVGNFRDELAPDIAWLLRHIEPGKLDPELAFALGALPGPDEADVTQALMPHLMAADLIDSVLAAAERGAPDMGGWDDAVLVALVDYLDRHGRTEAVLGIYERFGGGSKAVADRFDRLFADMPVERMARTLIPDIEGVVREQNAPAYLELADRFLATADPKTGLAMMALLPEIVQPQDAGAFYAREKSRLGRLTAHVVEKLGADRQVEDAILRMIVHWAQVRFGGYFAEAEFAQMQDAMALAGRMSAAPEGERLAQFREDYFAFLVERRWFLQADRLAGDFEFCGAAVRYFSDVAAQRPAFATPAGRLLTARLGQTALTFGGGQPLDILTSFAMMQDRPKFSFAPSPDYDEFCWWYLTRLAGARKVPPACLRQEIVAHLNAPVAPASGPFPPVTRFLKLLWTKSSENRRSFDLGNPVDRILFVLHLLRTELPRSEPYLPMFAPYLKADSLAARVVAALAGRDAAATGLPAIVVVREAPQDILLVGHAGKDSGLGRNFGMLARALESPGTRVTGIDFDAHADTVNDQLLRWYAGCRTRPVAVFAVNAHDVPDFFAKDRRGILFQCRSAGFFLWEVSRAPEVQRLGISLVDEIWAPTAYVASIYDGLAPTHVVGKGLFRGDEEFFAQPRARKANDRFTFVTVFDFDSSIERKNPVAVVMAFQDAFGVDEKVRLIVKTSNVNPQHWSNAQRHWERLIAAAAGDARVRIVNERLSSADMVALIRDADCVVSLHRAEGFGYLISDAMAYGTPVIASDYSGSRDFADESTAYPVACRLVPVPPGAARWRCEGAVWADADVASAAAQMRAVHDRHDEALQKAARAKAQIRTRYSIETFRKAVLDRVAALSRPPGKV